jgi:outer membrane receptor protein involved in Fe transport
VTSCLAQAPSDLAEASIEQLGHIKVYTASKHLQSGTDAPSSVTVVTADEIQKHGCRTVADVLQTVRGFFVTYDRNYSSVGVRGFARPGDFNTRVLLLVDGHRLNDNIYDEAMVGTEFPIDIDLISRIEIVRGPVSSLYGSNALFAVVNIITKRGHEIKGLDLSGETASFNSYKGRLSYGGRQHGIDFLISGSFYGSRGVNKLFFPQLNTPETNFGIARHGDDDQSGSALATLSFGDFTLQTVYGTREKGIPTGAYETIFNNSGTRTTDSREYFDLGYRHTLATSWDVLARVFYDRYSYQGTYMYSYETDPTEVTPNLDYADGKWWGTELQVAKTVMRRHRITAGSEFRNNFRQDQTNFDQTPFSLYVADPRSSFVAGLYLQDEISLTKSLNLNAGVRYDYYKQVDGNTDPRAALIYRPTPVSALKFIYGESFRIANNYERFYSVAPMLANPLLRPEKMRSLESVWEQGASEHLWFSASAFFNRMNKLITEIPAANESLIFQNVQDVNSAGFELEARTQLSQGLESTASYSFQHTKDADTGSFLSDSPRHLIKFAGTEPLFHKKLFVSVDAQYRSRIESLESGSISPVIVVNATVLSRSLGKRLDLSGSVYNLLDRNYFDPPSSANIQLPIPQQGRSLRLKLTWHSRER